MRFGDFGKARCWPFATKYFSVRLLLQRLGGGALSKSESRVDYHSQFQTTSPAIANM